MNVRKLKKKLRAKFTIYSLTLLLFYYMFFVSYLLGSHIHFGSKFVDPNFKLIIN